MWLIIKNNPIIGIGYNLLGAYRKNVLMTTVGAATGYGSDSSLLSIIVTTGPVGAIFLLYIFGYAFSKSFSVYELIIKAILIASLVIANFNNLLFYTLWIFPMLLLLDLEHVFAKNQSDLKCWIVSQNDSRNFLSCL